MPRNRLQTIWDFAAKGKDCVVAKIGTQYVSVRNNELVLTKYQKEAVAFKSHRIITDFLVWAGIDSRNARIAEHKKLVTQEILSSRAPKR